MASMKAGTMFLVIILSGLVLMGAYVLFVAPATKPGTVQSVITIPGQSNTNTGSSGFTQYNIGFTYNEANAIDGSSVSTTAPAYIVYHSNGQRLETLTSLFGVGGVTIASGSTATNFAVTAADDGHLFISINTGTGTHLPNPAAIMSSNTGLDGVKWIPVTSQNSRALVAELSIAQLGTPNYAFNPSLSMQLLVRASLLSTSLAVDSPTGKTGIGTASGTDVYVTWTVSSLSSTDTAAFGQVYFTSNQTSLYMQLQDLQITSSSSIVLLGSGSNVGASYIISQPWQVAINTASVPTQWNYWPLNKLSPLDAADTFTIGRASSQADSIRFTVHAQMSMAAGKVITIVFNTRITNYAGALQGTSGGTTGGWLQESTTMAA